MKKVSYVAFCEECGNPNEIKQKVLDTYFKELKLKHVYCTNCEHKNRLPEHILKIVDSL